METRAPRRSGRIAVVAIAVALLTTHPVAAGAQSTTTTGSTPPKTAATVPPLVKVPRRTGVLTDAAGLINGRNENAIISALNDAKLRAGARVEVLVISSLASVHAEAMGLDRFAQLAFDAWDLGDPVRHDGALVVVVRDGAQATVVSGAYYQHANDAALRSIVDATLVPAVRRREYSRGIVSAVDQIAKTLSLPVAPTTVPSTEPGLGGPSSGTKGLPPWAYGAIGGAVVVLAGATTLRRVRRGPVVACPQCGNATSLVRKGEADPDIVVDGGEPAARFLDRTHLRLRSCDVCGHQLLITPPAPIRCPRCTKPMLQITATTLRGATAEDPGAVDVRQRCASCTNADQRVINLPKLRQGGRVGADHVLARETD